MLGAVLATGRLKPSGKAGRVKQSVAFNLLLHLRRYAHAVLLFVSDPAVPFTNNLGERTIRMPKVKQKISGSLRKQGHGMLLQRAFAGHPIQPAPS